MIYRTLPVAALLVLFLAQPPARGQSRADVEVAYPTCGVALTGPVGWVQLPGARAGMVARWGKVDPATNAVLAMVTVEAEPTGAATVAQYVQAMAQRTHGAADPARVDIAGVKAGRITMPFSEGTGLRPTSAFVAVRGKLGYILAAYESPKNPSADALDSVRGSWRWLPVESAVKHVHELSQPFHACGISLQVPSTARPFDVKDDKNQTHLGVFDYLAGAPVMDIEVVRVVVPRDPKQVMDTIGQNVAQQLPVGQPLTWRDDGGQPRRWVSGSFDRSAPSSVRGKPASTTVVRYALVQTGEHEGALLTLQYVLGSPGERATFEEANQAVIRSIRPAEAGTAENSAPASGSPSGPRGDGSIQITRRATRRDKSTKP